MNLKNYFEKVDEFFTVDGLKNNWAVLAVISVFFAGLWLRYLPEQGMRYLQALDPYMIFRLSQHLALEGSLPATDFMRYFPYNAPTYLLNQGDIIFPAIFYWLGPFAVFGSYLEWAQFYPALMGALSTVVMYFFGKELFNKRVGAFSAFFLAVVPGVLRRSSAGFFEKEPIGTFFMMLTLYFFSRSWKRDDYLAGILSGISLGFFTISWGGSRMLWLLIPMVVGSVLFIDEDIKSLIIAYTPTVLVGGGVAATLNHNRFWFTGTLFVINMGILGLLWSRHLVEELELVREDYLKYYTPSLSLLGVLALALSPLYSEFLASKIQSLIGMATQSVGGDVIGGTVAENTAPGLGTIISSMGANYASNIHPAMSIFANITGSWPMMMIGIGLLGTITGFMLLRKYGFVDDEISDLVYFGGLQAVFVAWSLIMIGFFQQTFLFGLGAGATVLLLFIGFLSYLDDESVFKLVTMITGSVFALEILLFFSGSQIAYALMPATVLLLSGVIYLYYNDLFSTRQLELEWVYVLPLLWVVTNLLGAVAKSRLVFLSTFSVAFAAGFGISRIYDGVKTLDFNEIFEIEGEAQHLKYGLLAVIIGSMVAVNFGAGFVSAQGVGGSPNQAWYQSLDYMENQTEPGSVIMSWWDYGYHFESIGRRPAVADGGNAGYYSDDTRAVNMPLADFLSSSDPDLEFLDKHSVDYIVLDNTMIGKFSAVSQISNRNNQNYTSMITTSTSSNIRDSLSQSGNLTTVQFTHRSGIIVYAPVSTDNQSIEFSGAPTIQRQGQRIPISCVITEDGTTTFDVESPFDYCLAEDPYYSLERGFSSNQVPVRGILVPKSIQNSSLVQLYLADGTGLDSVEKVEEGSNDYLKMWKVTR